MTSVVTGNYASPTSVNPMSRPIPHTKDCDTMQEQPITSGASASHNTVETCTSGNTLIQKASKFGQVTSVVVQSLEKPSTQLDAPSPEHSPKPLALPDRSPGTNNLKVNPPAVGPSTSVVPNKLGNIVQISKEYGELHIQSPTSPATPRGDDAPSPNTAGESFGVRTLKKFKSLNSILSRRGSGQAGNTPRRTMSGPGRLSKGFRAFKESTVRGLKRLASAGRVRSRAAEDQ